ncbi:hypothetical protein OIU34_20100 [Pararhizobium sp. BT-229]|uniref:hypothetical protein n=1 Tax=Pararhizobium sp. BT-229 TaxID=2986923 RepID=UPI0021F6F570|nr:hypothetical protein [Pararhizobium sp. BT-229]MCV9964190.1 hypothetical protein [Pararhizobium sp. BT-229]
MEFKETGMGLFGWFDEDIAIFGGTRSNRVHPAGHLWCQFSVLDIAHRRATGEDRIVGRMELLIEYPIDESAPLLIRKLLNFDISKELRRNPRKGQSGEGLGRRAIEALARAATDDIDILDIKPGAKGFWAKMGVEMYPEQKRVNGILKPIPKLATTPATSPSHRP